MTLLGRIRWWRVLAVGLLAEIALILAVPIQLLPGGETLLLFLVIPLCLLVTGVAGFWIGRKVDAARVLHGALVGVVALLIYAALTWNQELPLAYVVANYLKIVGGAAGGWYADRFTAAPAQGTAA
jgi:hypothetical protein